MLARINNSAPVNTPFAPGEGLTRVEAAEYAGRCTRTIDGYAAAWPEIVERSFGRVLISKVALHMLRRKDLTALKLYGSGDRSHPRVLAYFDMTGVTPPVAADAGA